MNVIWRDGNTFNIINNAIFYVFLGIGRLICAHSSEAIFQLNISFKGLSLDPKNWVYLDWVEAAFFLSAWLAWYLSN